MASLDNDLSFDNQSQRDCLGSNSSSLSSISDIAAPLDLDNTMVNAFFMPAAFSRDAPRFSSDPERFDTFFEEIDSMGTRAKLTVKEKIEFAIRYARPESSIWHKLPSVATPGDNITFDDFKREVWESYPGLAGNLRYTLRDLERLVNRNRRLRDMDRDDLDEYYRKFVLYSDYLVDVKRMVHHERNRCYIRGFPSDIQAYIRHYLFVKNPDASPAEDFTLQDINKAVVRFLDDDHPDRDENPLLGKSRSRSRSPSLFRSTVRSSRARSPDSPEPPRRTRSPLSRRSGDRSPSRGRGSSRKRSPSPHKTSDKETRLMETFKSMMDSYMAANPPSSDRAVVPYRQPPPHQQYQQARDPAPGGAYQGPPRWDRPKNSDNYQQNCIFCSGHDHFLKECQDVAQYMKKGKVIRNDYGRVSLPDGRMPPRHIPGKNIKERIDNYYDSEGIRDEGGSRRETVSAHFLETSDEYIFSLEVEPTTDDQQEPSSQEDPLDELKSIYAKMEALEAQVRAVKGKGKEKFDGVEVPARKVGPPAARKAPSYDKPPAILSRSPLPNASANPKPASGEAPKPSERTAPRPGASKVPPRPQGPIRPVAYPAKPPVEEPKFRYQAPVEKDVDASELMDRVLNARIEVTNRELLALAPELRKGFKEATTGRKISANLYEQEEQIDTYLSSTFEDENSLPISFDVNRYDQSSVASQSLPLRIVHLTFAHGIEPECILDSGAQIVAMRKDIWEQLGVPLAPHKAMSMESANAETNMTMGLIENLPVKIGSVTLFLQVHVIESAPFEVLLGRPFYDVASCADISKSGGHHKLHINDPKTGEPLVIPTQPRPRKVKQEERVNFLE